MKEEMKKIIEDIFRENGSDPVKEIYIFKTERKGDLYYEVSCIQDLYLVYDLDNGSRIYPESSDTKEELTLEELSESKSEIVEKIKKIRKDEDGTIQTSGDKYSTISFNAESVLQVDGFKIGDKEYILMERDFDMDNPVYAKIRQEMGLFGNIIIYNLDCYELRIHSLSHGFEVLNRRKEDS